MTVFSQPFMFFDNPRGGTDQMDKAKSAGFLGGFGNVIDYPPEAWDQHRASAKQHGMFFGPWGRTGHPPPQGTGFEQEKAARIADVAVKWGSPCIFNCEKEIDNTGPTVTTWLSGLVGIHHLDAALSVEAWPFGNVDWKHWTGPVLPQIFPQDWWHDWTKADVMKHAAQCLSAWHGRGVKCVYYTFGTYGAQKPSDFELQAPYSLYTADAIGIQNYGLWKPTSSGFVGCVEPPKPDPPAALTPKQIRAGCVKLTDPWTKANPKQRNARVTVIDRIAEDFYTDAQWARMAPAIVAILDQEQDEG